MNIDPRTSIRKILDRFPATMEVFDGYGVGFEGLSRSSLDVRSLCDTYDLDIDEVLVDLRAAAANHRPPRRPRFRGVDSSPWGNLGEEWPVDEDWQDDWTPRARRRAS